MLTEIRKNSKWEALKDFNIGIGSHSQNPNTTNLLIKKGTFLIWDEDSPNGNVWFYVVVDGIKHRGRIECGCILNAVKDNRIQLIDNGQGFTIYGLSSINRYFHRQ
jgi:hypothetical protein